MKTYKILNVCGSGIATSTLISSKVKDAMKERGISVETTECNIREVSTMIPGFHPDVIIGTSSLESVDTKGIKTYSGMPILYGNKLIAKKTFDEIEAYLKSME
ncbi:MAG: hypothetical protein K0Q48_3083 [Bacillota bacterium]|jgi:PTS system galactitol-specific IIB component|nr:hypothetical protein [Bacillota bacterium]